MYNTANSFNSTSTFDANTNTFVIKPEIGVIENTPEAIAQSWMNVREFERRQRTQKFASANKMSYEDFDAWLDLVLDDINTHRVYGATPITKLDIEPLWIPEKAAKCITIDNGYVYVTEDNEIISGTADACLKFAMILNKDRNPDRLIAKLNRTNPNFYTDDNLNKSERLIVRSPFVKNDIECYREIDTECGPVITRYHRNAETGKLDFSDIVAMGDIFDYSAVKQACIGAGIAIGRTYNVPQEFYFKRGSFKFNIVNFEHDAYELSEFADTTIGGCINENNNAIETGIPSNNGTGENPVSETNNN